jgi:REP-associated tyrosine transposase
LEATPRKNRLFGFYVNIFLRSIPLSTYKLMYALNSSSLNSCIEYIDMNMVRSGVVDHPEQWRHGGYNEIQSPRRKCILIDYNALSQLAGFNDFESFKASHRRWVNAALRPKKDLLRESKWTQAIAVGDENFVATVKKHLRSLPTGRRVRSTKEGYELREAIVPYNGHSEAKKWDIHTNNTCFWNEKSAITE